jgi:hypothetical protein
MPFSIFVALSILGLDFMIFVLFKLLYGDRRSAIARQVAAQRKALGEPTPRPFLVSSREGAPATQSRPDDADLDPRMQKLENLKKEGGMKPPLQRTAPERSTHLRQDDRTQAYRLERSAS